jgi:hypothetical protein
MVNTVMLTALRGILAFVEMVRHTIKLIASSILWRQIATHLTFKLTFSSNVYLVCQHQIFLFQNNLKMQ